MDGRPDRLRLILAAGFCLLFASCSRPYPHKVIVLGVDGMDPGFVERHWADLPNLDRLRRRESVTRLSTTWPPQSPVAWSSFITGLSPDQTGIFDFIHRDASTMQPFLSTDRTLPARWVIPAGAYRLPLSPSRVISLRRGKPFWADLSARGIPITIMRIPANYPPSNTGQELAGMGVPDLRGTEGSFSYFTDDPDATAGEVAGGSIRTVRLDRGHAEFSIEGPPNSMGQGAPLVSIKVAADVDPLLDYVRLSVGDRKYILKEKEWSDWIPVKFVLVPHVASVRGIFRVYARQLHPHLAIYVSPVNVDPNAPALPISSPPSWSKAIAREIGLFGTLGIPEDTSAARAGALNIQDFEDETKQIGRSERRLLDYSLRHFAGGLLFFYFSTVDQASHMLWEKHEPQLLSFYRDVDNAIGEVMRREPDSTVIVMSDHGFNAFRRAVNLNTWLLSQGWLALNTDGGIDWPRTQAYALGLNGLYLNVAGREKNGIVPPARVEALKEEIRDRLMGFRDPDTGAAVLTAVQETHAAGSNRNAAPDVIAPDLIAPDLIVGYAPGYRASWETALAHTPAAVIEENNDLWIGDHCIDPAHVRGVLFAPAAFAGPHPRLRDLAGAIMRLFPPN